MTRENASPAGEISVERESFRGSGENAASGLQQVEQREARTEGPGHLTAVLSLRVHLPAHTGAQLCPTL